MLALNGGIRIWHISDVVDMRYGKYRLYASTFPHCSMKSGEYL